MRPADTPFEQQLPARERTLLGQFYTPRRVADLLVALTVDRAHTRILDPGCGAGELLLAAHDHFKNVLHHPAPLALLAGLDLNPAAVAHAAASFRQHAGAAPSLTVGDFFTHPPSPWDCILANPPYVRSQHQDTADPSARARLFAAAAAIGVAADAKTDLFAFFLYRALQFLRPGGRLGFITPATWLTSHYAAALQRVLTGPLHLAALVASSAESFIPGAKIHTLLVIADRPAETRPPPPTRLVTLRQPLSAFASLPTLADEIRACDRPHEDDRLRIHLLPATTAPASWSRLLRGPRSHDLLFTRPAFTPLATVATVSLGYKSLQNDFYYLPPATVRDHAVEDKYLHPIHRLGDLDGFKNYLHTTPASQHIFLCRAPPSDLRGTGALRYIEAMADRPAARRKQTATTQTIREALAAQGGALWYAPKARPHAAHIWLRKAVDGVHAPLLFPTPAVVDQRCNALEPRPGLPWDLLAAVLTSSLFAYAVETHGSASLGAGALEATTTHLRDYPVFDPRPLDPAARDTLRALATDVWTHESPIDWRRDAHTPGPALRALDTWLLARTGADVSPARLYTDLHTTCRARITVARPR